MFLVRKKPTSPALRWASYTSNQTYKRFRIKKMLPSRNYRGFECKKMNRKSVNRPSTKHYKLSKHYIYATRTATVLSMHKDRSFNYITACITMGQRGKYYVKAADGMATGSSVPYPSFFRKQNSLFLGNRLNVLQMPTGGLCYALKATLTNRLSIAESAGTYCKVLWHDKDAGVTTVTIPSKQNLRVGLDSMCNVGRVSNIFHQITTLGNARNAIKKKGKIISVRGIAMNPIDHPNGGRANTRRPMRNPWGKVAKKGK